MEEDAACDAAAVAAGLDPTRLEAGDEVLPNGRITNARMRRDANDLCRIIRGHGRSLGPGVAAAAAGAPGGRADSAGPPSMPERALDPPLSPAVPRPAGSTPMSPGAPLVPAATPGQGPV
eukprot:14075451-Alexandrium_andersonii.AAC.1